MAIWDVINSNKDKYDVGGSDYNPYQSNIAGDSLAPTNYKGQLAAVDPDNDTRSPEQFKRDAQQAQRDASNSPDEDENMFISDNGNKYEKVNNSALHEGLSAGLEFLTTYLSTNGNVGAALDAGGRKVADLNDRAHRLSQVNDLEKKGYNPLDIQQWVNTGDRKALITNKGEWSAVGDGRTLYNKLTAETKIVGATGAKEVDKSVNLDDGSTMLIYKDGTRETINPYGANAPTVQNTNYGPGNLPGGGSLDNEASNYSPVRERQGKQMPIADMVDPATGQPVYTNQSGGASLLSGQVVTPIAKSQYEAQQKNQTKESGENTQAQAIATNSQTAISMGNDIMANPTLKIAGSNYSNEISRWKDTKFGKGNTNYLNSQIDQYNHNLTTLGQAQLYQEAGGKRIFAEEMQSAGKNFMPLDINMSEKQLKDAITYNNSLASRFQNVARQVQQGHYTPNASKNVYGESYAAPVPSSNPQAQRQPQQQSGVINITRGPDGKLVRAGG